MAGQIELTIRSECDGGEGWLDLDDCVVKQNGGVFAILDAGALDILEAILHTRREGTYTFPCEAPYGQ